MLSVTNGVDAPPRHLAKVSPSGFRPQFNEARGGLGQISDTFLLAFHEKPGPSIVTLYADASTAGRWVAGVILAARFNHLDDLRLAGGVEGRVVTSSILGPRGQLPPPAPGGDLPRIVADLALIGAPDGLRLRALPRVAAEPWRLYTLGSLDAFGLPLGTEADCVLRPDGPRGRSLRAATEVLCEQNGGIVHREVMVAPDAAIGPALAAASGWTLPDGCSGELVLRFHHEMSDRALTCEGAEEPAAVPDRLSAEARVLDDSFPNDDLEVVENLELVDVEVKGGPPGTSDMIKRLLSRLLARWIFANSHNLEPDKRHIRSSFEVAPDGSIVAGKSTSTPAAEPDWGAHFQRRLTDTSHFSGRDGKLPPHAGPENYRVSYGIRIEIKPPGPER